MSATSRIPQNRPSRIAGPSKLPSRILRPTFTNKTHQTPSSNFVSSAKQFERKKEAACANGVEQLTVDSNRNIKIPNTRNNQPNQTKLRENKTSNPSVDCNGNKSNFNNRKIASEEQVSVTINKESLCNEKSKSTLKNRSTLPKNFQSEQQNTVRDTKRTPVKKTNLVPDSTTADKQEKQNSPAKMNNISSTTGGTGPSFRSMKPGYFLQKVNAIKSSHQRVNPEKSHASSSAAIQESTGMFQTTFSLPPRTTVSTIPQNRRFGYKTDKNELKNETSSDGKTSSTHNAPPKSKMSQPATRTQHAAETAPGQQLNGWGSYTSRAEKRKKYLEGKNNSKNSSQENDEPTPAVGASPVENNQTKQDIPSPHTNLTQTASNRNSYLQRPFFGKRSTRNVKIARPVIRPKTTPSPTYEKPFTPVQPTQSKYDTPGQKTEEIPENLISDRGNLSPLKKIENQKPISPKISNSEMSSIRKHSSQSSEKFSETDQYSVASALSEESGYSSVASTVFLDNQASADLAGISQSIGISHNSTRNGNRPYSSETDAVFSQKTLDNHEAGRSHSHSSGETPQSEDKRDAEHKRYCSYIASEDIITYGQYRIQAEGNYAVENRYVATEGRQIRTSVGSDSSDSDLLLQERKSPADCDNENASDSSVETVIPNTRSPEIPDSCEQTGNENVQQSNGNARQDSTEEYSDEIFREDMTEKTEVSITMKTSDQLVYQFTSASNETLFATTVASPEPTGNVLTPSTNSTSKAKKRKTDSVLMSPLYPETEIPGQNEEKESKVSVEKEIIFDDDPDSNLEESDEEEENLSSLIELPSLHESALMGDYNSMIEDDTLSESEEDVLNEKITNGYSSPQIEPIASNKISSMSTPSVQTNVINKLLSNGFDGILGSCEDSKSTLHVSNTNSNTVLTNGYHDDQKSVNSPTKRQLHNSKSTPDHQGDAVNQDDLLQECGVFKMLLLELHRILEIEKEKKDKQVEENRRLQLKNVKLIETVKNLTQEMATMKLSMARPVCEDKTVQTETICTDVSTNTDIEGRMSENESERESQDSSAQTSTSPRWFHSEVSNEVKSNIKEATEEINYLKNLHGDFDRRISGAEQRLNSALQLLHS